MASKIKVDTLETAKGSGTIALSNQLSGMTTASLPALGSAQMPSGSVLQVVYASTSTTVQSSSTTLVDTGLTASITPSSTSSKVLVIISQNGMRKAVGNTGNRILLQLYKNNVSNTKIGGGLGYNDANDYNGENASLSLLDSPSSTSTQTYKTMFSNETAASNVQIQHSGATSTITLMEIQG